MGIKRTPTGRIYYEAEENKQSQMVGLLGQLGDRLRRSESEREEIRRELDEYRSLINEIENKTEGSEKAFISVQNKLSRTEKIESEILQRQKELEEIQNEFLQSQLEHQEQNSTLLKQLEESRKELALLSEKLEENDLMQKRMEKRLEKSLQEKSRLSRKVERLEENLIETQDILRAKAMIFLTDQSIAENTALPHIKATDDIDIYSESSGNSKAGNPIGRFFAWIFNPQMISAISMVVIAIFAGKIALNLNALDLEDTAFPANIESYFTKDRESTDQSVMSQSDILNNDLNNDLSFPLPPVEQLPLPDSNTNEIATGTDTITDNDRIIKEIESGTHNDQELAEIMEESPDRLASIFNQVNIGETGNDEELNTTDIITNDTDITADFPKENSADKTNNTVKTQNNTENSITDNVDPLLNIKKRATEGVATAQHDLAAMYTSGSGSIQQDYEQAAYWFRKAADQGIPNAAYNLGVLYHNGLGVKQNIDEAIKWYEKASNERHPEASYNLGIAHIEGIGVPYNPQKAAMYFETAAEQGIMEAAYNLGLVYENGLLGSENLMEALYWYNYATERGSMDARIALEQLAKKLRIAPQDIAKTLAEEFGTEEATDLDVGSRE